MPEYYTDDNPYLDDAVSCPKCGNIPYERIGQDAPIMLCGIPLPTGYGTYLECGCGNRTQTYRQPWRAYLEWNKKYQ